MKKNLIPVSLVAAACVAVSALALARQEPRSGPDRAPELVGGPWLNTQDGSPITIRSRKGKPTLVAFWTFGCENCQANFAPYSRLLKKYRSKGVELIAVHTPEMQVERNVSNVAAHVLQDKIDYPVLIDNAGLNWKNWGVNVWPSLYVVDGKGVVRYHWFGELNWNQSGGEAKIAEILDALLAETN